MKRRRLFAVIVGIAVVCRLGAGNVHSEQDDDRGKAATSPTHVYRAFKLPDADPQLSVKMFEYEAEGWRLASSNTTAPVLFRRPLRNAGDLDENLLKTLQGAWDLTADSENGVKVWPKQPCVEPKKKSSPPSPLTLTFDKARFWIEASGAAAEAKVTVQHGTIQHLSGSVDEMRIDLLIGSDDSTNPWFTIRCLASVSESDLSLSSGGSGDDRPTSTDSATTASSTYTRSVKKK